MSRPLVTVVMTAYNAEDFIIEALHSIRNQTFQNFELMICDDGSTDSTSRLIEMYLSTYRIGSRPRGWCRYDENEGVAAGRTHCISLANTKYIAIADADDISDPTRLAQQVKFMEGHENIFCCGAGIVKIDENGNFLTMHQQPKFHEGIVAKVRRGVNPIYDPTVMFRMDDFLKVGGYCDAEDRLYVPDWDLWCRAILAGLEFYNLPEFLVHYRVHPASNCNRHLSKVLEQHGRVFEEFKQKDKGNQL
jgi:glycosyltransferase EpsE